MSAYITARAKVANLSDRTLAGRWTVHSAAFVCVVNSDAAKPMIGGVIGGVIQVRRRSNGIISGNQGGPNGGRHPRGHGLHHRGTEGGNARVPFPLHELSSTPRGAIARRVPVAHFAMGESLAFFRFARAAVLAGAAGGVVPREAAEEMVFRAEVPGYRVGGCDGQKEGHEERRAAVAAAVGH